jgi:hypothetical protein
MFQVNPIISSNDVRALNRGLREIEPGLVREMRKEIRQIAKPVNDQIKKNIPAQAPMSGMSIGSGRLRWLGDKKPQSTTISNALKASGRSLTGSLVRIIVNSPAASMADMAGRVNRSRPISREYNYRLRDGSIIKRRHRVTTQGQQMIRNLGARASRFAWPALENRLDEVTREIDKVLEKYYRIANRGN